MTIARARYGIGCGAVPGKADLRRERRRREDRQEASIGLWGMIFILTILALGMVIGYGWRAWLEAPAPKRVIAQPSDAEKRWIEQRHKYHGIWASIEENGEYYFYRDGKKCKL